MVSQFTALINLTKSCKLTSATDDITDEVSDLTGSLSGLLSGLEKLGLTNILSTVTGLLSGTGALSTVTGLLSGLPLGL